MKAPLLICAWIAGIVFAIHLSMSSASYAESIVPPQEVAVANRISLPKLDPAESPAREIAELDDGFWILKDDWQVK